MVREIVEARPCLARWDGSVRMISLVVLVNASGVRETVRERTFALAAESDSARNAAEYFLVLRNDNENSDSPKDKAHPVDGIRHDSRRCCHEMSSVARY